MSKVILAGYNVDAEVLADIVKSAEGDWDLTPETLSAAYARISRDARPVNELRQIARADVAKTRRQNERIVFGLGHHSVAEHAVFNFDLINISRLAIEYLESHRLASYTEKSQRYIRLDSDFLIPEEWQQAGLKDELKDFILYCFERYEVVLEKLKSNGIDEKLAGEDARYMLPLAAFGQLGMTLNARSLEYMILRLAASPLKESREIASKLLEAARPIAPSLLRYMDPTPYHTERFEDTHNTLNQLMSHHPAPDPVPVPAPAPYEVALLDFTTDGDSRILAALAQHFIGGSFSKVQDWIDTIGDEGRLQLFNAITGKMSIHDAVPREFEHGIMTFEVIMSAAAFAQFKRHRMTSITWNPYDPDLGLTVPKAITDAGLQDELLLINNKATKLANKMGMKHPATPYVWTNAHRRRVLITLNLREMYHMSRLREDESAQWDIRQLVGQMSELARQVFPICAGFLGGKDQFPK